jgi:hypothetical protein
MSPLGRIGCFSTRASGVDRQRPDRLRPAEDAMQLDQELVLGAVRQAGQRSTPQLSYFSMPPVGFEPTTFGLKVVPIQVFWAVHAVLGCAEFG